MNDYRVEVHTPNGWYVIEHATWSLAETSGVLTVSGDQFMMFRDWDRAIVDGPVVKR